MEAIYVNPLWENSANKTLIEWPETKNKRLVYGKFNLQVW